jgi:hypothetical protein
MKATASPSARLRFLEPLMRQGAALFILLACANWPAISMAAGNAATQCMSGFTTVEAGHDACGYALSASGALTLDGRSLANPFIVSYEDGGDKNQRKAFPATRVKLFPPSPTDRYRIIQGCQASPDASVDEALCWATRIVDEKSGRMREIYAGRYGPDAWQSWSASGRRVLLSSHSEGASWLYVIDAVGGRAHVFPSLDSNENWIIQRDTAHWITSRSISVVVQACADCVAKRRTLRF